MLRLNLNYFYIFTFIMLFCFQCFVIPIGSKFVVIGSLLMIFSFILALIKNYKHFIFRIKEFLNNKNSILFFLFILWIILSGLILIVLGKTSLKITGGHILTGIVYSVIFPLFYGFFITKEIGAKNIIKILLIALYGMLLFGIFDFLIFYFDIMPLKKIYWFFVNSQHLRSDSLPRTILLFGVPRVRSTFQEPCVYVYYLAILLPFIYYFVNSKYKLLKNKYINNLIKKSFIPFVWINILFTFSPIGIIMSIISTILYYLKTMKINIRKIFIIFCFGLLISGLLFVLATKTIIGEKILSRILSISYIFTDFEKFALIEGSLATRLVYYINCFIIGFKNIILGTGWGHLGIDLTNQLIKSPLPLTMENIDIFFVKGIDTTSFVESFACCIFGATGFIGFALFYSFVFNLYKKLIIIKKYVLKLDKTFCSIFILYLTLFIIFSFYESYIYYQYYWLIFGIIIAYIQERKDKACN